MGLIRKLILGRWGAKWLLRGGPWAVAAKLGLVALYGAWRWRREHGGDSGGKAMEIEADYEVLDDPSAEPVPGEQGTMGPGSGPFGRIEIEPNGGAQNDEL